jgi:hypothetical protein
MSLEFLWDELLWVELLSLEPEILVHRTTASRSQTPEPETFIRHGF